MYTYNAPKQAKLVVLQLLIVKGSPEKLLYDRSSMEIDTPIVDENCQKSKVPWTWFGLRFLYQANQGMHLNPSLWYSTTSSFANLNTVVGSTVNYGSYTYKLTFALAIILICKTNFRWHECDFEFFQDQCFGIVKVYRIEPLTIAA
jgi:hypothetical protein